MIDDHEHEEDGVTSDARARTLEAGPDFHVDERVLCTDARRPGAGDGAPPLYEAIVRRSDVKYVAPRSGDISELRAPRDDDHVKEWCHLVHWQGWNARYDTWKIEAEVFHDTPENRQRVEANSGKVARTPPKPKKKKKRAKGAREGDGEESPPGAGSTYQQNLELLTRACALPFTLQTLLVDDSEKITRKIYPPPNDAATEGKGRTLLHALPKTTNIIEVLGRYVRVKKREDLEDCARAQARQREEDARRPAQPHARVGDADAADEEGARAQERRREEETPPPTQQQSTADDADANRKGSRTSTASTDARSREDGAAAAAAAAAAASPAPSHKAILRQKKRKRKRFAWSVLALVDLSLPLFLLYGEEQEQFATVIAGGCTRSAAAGDDEEDENNSEQEETTTHLRPSDVYGAEHLLRLFVKLPHILSHYDSEENAQPNLAGEDEDKDEEQRYILASKQQSQDFAKHLKELIVFLQQNLECFEGKYYAVG